MQWAIPPRTAQIRSERDVYHAWGGSTLHKGQECVQKGGTAFKPWFPFLRKQASHSHEGHSGSVHRNSHSENPGHSLSFNVCSSHPVLLLPIWPSFLEGQRGGKAQYHKSNRKGIKWRRNSENCQDTGKVTHPIHHSDLMAVTFWKNPLDFFSMYLA